MIKKVIYFALVFYLSYVSAANFDAIQKNVSAGHFQEAYLLAVKLQDQYVGEPQFDYWFGRAAYENQIYDQASFAFERVLIAEPNHTSAQQYLTLCYQKMGHGPKHKASTAQYAFSLSRGWDSNINEGTEIQTLHFLDPALPIPLIIPIDETIRSVRDAFTRIRIKGNWSASMTDKHAWFLSVSAFYKKQDKYKNKRFDTADFSMKTGFSWKHHQNELTIPFILESFHTDARNLNNNPRITASVGPSYTLFQFEPHQWVLFGEGGGIRYPQNSSHDIDFLLGGLEWSYAVSRMPILWTMRGYGGLQHPKHTTNLSKRYGNSFGGIGATFIWRFIPKQLFYSGVNLERRHYWSAFPLPEKRRDHVRAFSLGWQWDLTEQVALRTEYSFRNNGSNIPLLAFDKRVLEITLEYHLD